MIRRPGAPGGTTTVDPATVLTPVPDRVAVVACSTCRSSAGARGDTNGQRGGAQLVEALRAVQAEPGYESVAVEVMACLFACEAHCTVHLRGPGKIGYVLGRFTPDRDAARAILDYAVRYAASAEGQVPFRDWPEGVKGHFLTRTPPPGFLIS